jgi:hypothetical protein
MNIIDFVKCFYQIKYGINVSYLNIYNIFNLVFKNKQHQLSIFKSFPSYKYCYLEYFFLVFDEWELFEHYLNNFKSNREQFIIFLSSFLSKTFNIYDFIEEQTSIPQDKAISIG